MILALTGKGGGPSGTQPWGQENAAISVGTTAPDVRARHAENAVEPSHTARLVSVKSFVVKDKVDAGCPWLRICMEKFLCSCDSL